MRCVIIDDEPLATDLLAAYANKVDDLEVLAVFNNPLEALKLLRENPVDVLFLDIQMPEITGVEFKKIIQADIPVVFTTAYPDYALEGFELNAVDYLLKPITFQRFLTAIEKVKAKRVQPPDSPSDYLFVKTEYRHQRVEYGDIFYFKGLGDYVAIHTKDGKILTLENMKHFGQHLPPDRFIRVHKSYIVALEKVEYIERNRIVIQGEYIPIGATYKEAFWQRVNG